MSKWGEAMRLHIGGRLGSRLKAAAYPHVLGELARESREPGRFVWKPEDVAPAESVSTALMLVLETLAPTERAVFVLHEVFDVRTGRDR